MLARPRRQMRRHDDCHPAASSPWLARTAARSGAVLFFPPFANALSAFFAVQCAYLPIKVAASSTWPFISRSSISRVVPRESAPRLALMFLRSKGAAEFQAHFIGIAMEH